MPGKPKMVRDIKPGDRVPSVRTVVEVSHTRTTTTLTFNDGSSQTFDIAGAPAIDVET